MNLFNTFLIVVSTYSALVFADSRLSFNSGRRHVVVCERSTLNIRCELDQVIDVLRVNYGRLSDKVCNADGDKPIRDLNCVSRNSLDIVRNKCSNHQSCSVDAINSVFGDPCKGTYKYLDVEFQCISRPNDRDRQRRNRKQAVACESTTLSIKCKRGYEITILNANYGRLSKRVCNSDGRAPIRDLRCSSHNSEKIVRDHCSGKRRCEVSATNKVFGDPCFGTLKYLKVDYICTEKRRRFH